jgi:hypothetical protein
MPTAASSCAHAGGRQRVARGGELALPDLLRVVLHPAGLGEVLREFALGHTAYGAAGVNDDGAGAGGALVEGQHIRRHGRVSLSSV